MLIVSFAVRLVLRFGRTDLPMWFLSRVLRLGRSAAQILQNGPLHRALCQLGCAPFCAPLSLCCSVFPAHRPKSSTTDLLFSLLRSLTSFSRCTSELLSGILAHHAREPNAKMQKCTVFSKVCAKVLSRLWSCSGQVSVSRIPIETRRTTKDDEEKKTSNRVSRVPLRDLRGKKFQGFLSGTSGEKKIKKNKKNKTGTYH